MPLSAVVAVSWLLHAAPSFEGSHAPLTEAERAAMRGVSWREGCPVPLEDLERVEISHWGFDGAVHRGAVIVHRDVSQEVVEVFHALFDARFPIERLEPVEAYGGDDDRSMAANNSSGFNCRPNASNPGEFSKHAWGKAIDLNPLQNPYVRGEDVRPPDGRAFLKQRDAARPPKGVISLKVRSAFRCRNWMWGGNWKRVKDYQHFER